MSVAATLLTADGNTTTKSTDDTTASVSLVTDRLYIVVVAGKVPSGACPTPTMTGASQTWTQIATILNDAGDSERRLTFFRCQPTSNASGALTISWAGTSMGQRAWAVVEFTGTYVGSNGSAAVIQNASANYGSTTNTGITVTLSAFARSGNATFGAVFRSLSAAITQGSGFTELYDHGTAPSTEVEFKASADTSVDWTWASATNQGVALAVEIAAAWPHAHATIIG